MDRPKLDISDLIDSNVDLVPNGSGGSEAGFQIKALIAIGPQKERIISSPLDYNMLVCLLRRDDEVRFKSATEVGCDDFDKQVSAITNKSKF